MPSCYLTIDDSPTPFTIEMIDFLAERDIPALLFIRGDMIRAYGEDALLYALEKGYHLANHADTHTHFSQLTYDQAVAEIERMEAVIEKLYQTAGIKRPGKYFRFPHMDRGAGIQVVDYDRIPDEYRDDVERLFKDGIRGLDTPQTDDQLAYKQRLQDYLKRHDFYQPFDRINHLWFKETEMAQSYDCMITFSTSDWMLLDRHRGKWAYTTMEDLKAKIDHDPWLNREDSHNIILIHDKPEPEFPQIFKTLIDYMVSKGYHFLKTP